MVLGVPVGGEEFVLQTMRDRLSELKDILRKRSPEVFSFRPTCPLLLIIRIFPPETCPLFRKTMNNSVQRRIMWTGVEMPRNAYVGYDSQVLAEATFGLCPPYKFPQAARCPPYPSEQLEPC